MTPRLHVSESVCVLGERHNPAVTAGEALGQQISQQAHLGFVGGQSVDVGDEAVEFIDLSCEVISGGLPPIFEVVAQVGGLSMPTISKGLPQNRRATFVSISAPISDSLNHLRISSLAALLLVAFPVSCRSAFFSCHTLAARSAARLPASANS